MFPISKRIFLLLIICVLYQGVEGLTKNLTENANFEILLNVYEDVGHTIPVTELSSIDTNQHVYLKAEVKHMTDAQLDLFPTFCFATPSADDEDTVSYPLLDSGCSNSSYVTDISTDSALQNPNFRFTTKVFRFTQADSDSIYFHCDVTICQNGTCAIPSACPDVVSRRKRSTSLMSKRISARLIVQE